MGGVSDRYPIGDRTTEDGHAADAMVELALRWGGDLTIIALGPLTNVAVALERDAAAMRSIRELVVMGGSADGNGNVTPAAEFNFFSDPVAADTVLRSGLPVTVVGLNVTEQARLSRARFEARLHAMPAGPLNSYLGDISSPYFDFCRKESGVDACALHDPLAVAVAISPDLVKCETMTCKVVTSQGLARGAMISDRAKSGRQVDAGCNCSGCRRVPRVVPRGCLRTLTAASLRPNTVPAKTAGRKDGRHRRRRWGGVAPCGALSLSICRCAGAARPILALGVRPHRPGIHASGIAPIELANG